VLGPNASRASLPPLDFTRYQRGDKVLVTGKKYSKTGIRQGFAKYMVKNPCVSERPYKLVVRIFEYFLPGTSTAVKWVVGWRFWPRLF